MSDAGDVFTVIAVPFTPVAAGVTVVPPAPIARITTDAESWPAGMKAGSGEIDTRPAVPWLYVTNVPPAGDGSESRTCVVSWSFVMRVYDPLRNDTVACTTSTAVSPAKTPPPPSTANSAEVRALRPLSEAVPTVLPAGMMIDVGLKNAIVSFATSPRFTVTGVVSGRLR